MTAQERQRLDEAAQAEAKLRAAWQRRFGELEAKLSDLGIDPFEFREWIGREKP